MSPRGAALRRAARCIPLHRSLGTQLDTIRNRGASDGEADFCTHKPFVKPCLDNNLPLSCGPLRKFLTASRPPHEQILRSGLGSCCY